jgi:hypothetical protein
MEVLKKTYRELPNIWGACKFQCISLLKMGDFYQVNIWTKFHNYTNGEIITIDCDTDIHKAIAEFIKNGGVWNE